MPHRMTVYRRRLKEENKDKYAEYLQKQKEAVVARRLAFKNEPMTRAKEMKIQERNAKLRLREKEKKAHKNGMISTCRSISLSKPKPTYTPHKKPKDMTADELREHKRRLRQESRSRESSLKKRRIREKAKTHMRQRRAKGRHSLSCPPIEDSSTAADITYLSVPWTSTSSFNTHSTLYTLSPLSSFLSSSELIPTTTTSDGHRGSEKALKNVKCKVKPILKEPSPDESSEIADNLANPDSSKLRVVLFKRGFPKSPVKQPVAKAECENQVKGFSKPAFKKFSSLQEAQEFVSSSVPGPVQRQVLQPENDASNTTRLLGLKTNSPVALNGDSEVEQLRLTVSEMQSKMHRMFTVMEGLRSDVCRLQSTVDTLEKAVFQAPGAQKRSFSTSPAASGSKKHKADSRKNTSFTGAEFEDSDGVHVYTDGGCFGNGNIDAQAGIGVFWGENDPNNISEPLSGRPSNNRAEIHAAVKAVQIAKTKGIKNLILHTDSQFLINGITKWIKGWKKNGWKLSTGHPVINKDDFTALDTELSGISVKWVYVKGHSGHPGNEKADRLAKQGAQKSGNR